VGISFVPFGVPLAGLTVKVTPSAVGSNTPVVYSNSGRAILALEKGPPRVSLAARPGNPGLKSASVRTPDRIERFTPPSCTPPAGTRR
jgi:hypothetical protein